MDDRAFTVSSSSLIWHSARQSRPEDVAHEELAALCINVVFGRLSDSTPAQLVTCMTWEAPAASGMKAWTNSAQNREEYLLIKL
jgi:hypothetical protein